MSYCITEMILIRHTLHNPLTHGLHKLCFIQVWYWLNLSSTQHLCNCLNQFTLITCKYIIVDFSLQFGCIFEVLKGVPYWQAIDVGQTRFDRIQRLQGDVGKPQTLKSQFVNGIRARPAVFSPAHCQRFMCSLFQGHPLQVCANSG
jgi:hypothetical protein